MRSAGYVLSISHAAQLASSDNKHGHPVELLRLSARSYNSLIKAGITTIEHTIKMEYALTAVRGLGQKGIEEIRNALAEWKESGIDLNFSAELAENSLRYESAFDSQAAEQPPAVVSHVHPIQLLQLTPGNINALLSAGITTVEGALKLEHLLDGIPGLGESGADRVRQSLTAWKRTKFYSAAQEKFDDEDKALSFTSFPDLFQQIVNRYTTGKKGGSGDSRRANVIMARFTGHTSYDEKHTLEEIGQKFGITRERVRQICEQFMLYLDFFFGYYLRQRMLDLDIQLTKKGIFDFDTFRNVTSSVFPEFRDLDFFDLLHLLVTKNEISEVTGEVQAHEKMLLFSYKLPPPAIVKIRSCITECIEKNGITSANEIITYVASEFGVDKELVRHIIEYSQVLTINSGQITRRKMTRGDMLVSVFEKEGRDMHYSEAATLVNEKFGMNIAGHNAQGVLLADNRFIWVGQGRFALAKAGLLRGKTEEVIEHFLNTRGGTATLREIIDFMKTQRSLSDAAISLAIERSSNIARVQPGVFRLIEPNENKQEVELANTTIKLKHGIMQVLAEATEPLSPIEISQKIKEKFGEKCSNDMKTIRVYLNRDMHQVVHKNSKKKYMLYSKLDTSKQGQS